MSGYLNNTGKLFLTALAVYVGAKVYEKNVQRSIPVNFREKMTPAWRSQLETAFLKGDVRGFADLFRSINPSMTESDVLECWDIMRR